MQHIDPATLAPALAALLTPPRLNPLGPGEPNRAARAALEALAGDAAFAPEKIVDRDMAQACWAGLWLYHDFLDEAHRISQDLETPAGSYWHALMHRREPDFGNSKYWFRRVGAHPVFEPLRIEAARLAAGGPAGAGFLARQARWDPFAFVDLCEANYSEKAACHELCRQVQRVEWELLFAFCYQRTVGAK
jgi:hypothetical protein